MKYMDTYDLMESIRNTNEWMGATARAMASYPAFALTMNPMLQMAAAWGEVTERSFGRMVTKPDWGIRSIPGSDGTDLELSSAPGRGKGLLLFVLGHKPLLIQRLLIRRHHGKLMELVAEVADRLLGHRRGI